MNIINKLTLRHLKLNRKRTIVTVIGVVLSVAMLTGVTTVAASARDMLVQFVISNTGNWHGVFRGVDLNKTAVFQDGETKDYMLVRDLGYASLEGVARSGKPYLFIREMDEKSMANLALNLVEGRLPEHSHELVISEHIWSNGGVRLELGDQLELNVGQRRSRDRILGQRDPFAGEGETLELELTREYTVVGIISRPGFEDPYAPSYTVISFLDGSSTGQVDVYVQFREVTLDIFRHARELASSAAMERNRDQAGNLYYDLDYNEELLALYGVTANENRSKTIYIFALTAIGVIMVGSVAMIYNAFSISVAERSRQLGLMSSAGATKLQKRNSVLLEGLFIALAGIPLGLVAGIGITGVAVKLASPLLAGVIDNATRLRLVVSPLSIWAALLCSALTILVSVWMPALRASRISPMDAIRQSRELKLSGKAVRTSWLTKRLLGFEAELALKNLKRNRRRYRSTVISLSLSVILFIAVNASVHYGMISAEMSSQDLNYDIMVRVVGSSPQEEHDFLNRVAVIDEVDDYVYEQNLTLTTLIDGNKVIFFDEADRINFGTADPFQFQVRLKSLNDEAFTAYARKAGAGSAAFASDQPAGIVVNLNRGYADKVVVETELIKAQAGDVLHLEDPSLENYTGEILIAALTDHVPMGTSVWTYRKSLTLIVPEHVFATILADLPQDVRVYRHLYINTRAPEVVEEKVRELLRDTSEEMLMGIHNQALTARRNKAYMTLVTAIAMGFIALMTAICVANIINTISTSIGLRRREFAMLKSAGMTPEGFNRMIKYESIFYGIKALSIGLPVSLAINYILYRGMREGFYFSFTLPWASYGVVVASVFIIVFTTMLYSSARIKRENIMDSLRDENM